MKRVFVIFAVIVLFVFSACNSSRSGDRKPAVETEEVTPSTPPPASAPAPAPKDETVSASAFYLGEYTVQKEKYDEGQGEAGPYTADHAAFQLDVVINGVTKSIPMTANDYWDHKDGQKDPGKTEELKKLYERMKAVPASRIQIVLRPDGTVKEMFLLAEYEDGKDGAAGKIVSPKIQIFPQLMAQ